MLTEHKVPRSDAKNLYDLLKDTCTAITQEPKRVYMPTTVHAFKNPKTGIWVTKDEDELDEVKIDGPACGTIGCIAGWMQILTRKNDKDFRPDDFIDGNPLILNLNLEQQARKLFTTDFPTAKYGTRAYARHVIKNIRTFMAKHKETLKSMPVVRS